eukprot:scaffold6454_cov66-Phaeocystis_antarctica.AAC.8
MTSAAPSRNLGFGGGASPLARRRESRMLRMMPSGAAKFLSVALVYLSSIETSMPPAESSVTIDHTSGV